MPEMVSARFNDFFRNIYTHIMTTTKKISPGIPYNRPIQITVSISVRTEPIARSPFRNLARLACFRATVTGFGGIAASMAEGEAVIDAVVLVNFAPAASVGRGSMVLEFGNVDHHLICNSTGSDARRLAP
jgi:hypothetical protein